MSKEKVFIILVAACILSVVIFMVGGIIQDVDYHDISELSLVEQSEAYSKLQARRSFGEKTQLVGAILAFNCFIAIMVFSLVVSSKNANKREKFIRKTN